CRRALAPSAGPFAGPLAREGVMAPLWILPWRRPVTLSLLVAVVVFGATPSAAAQAPAGQATMAWHVTIAPSWFDPSTAPPQITPFGILYALHDALVRPYPGQKMGPSLAEPWRQTPGGQP